ncbi:hypothetical protein RF11_11268 [Thelohanellus kitauei]|uniref:Uncharacterized protein n=1 Tax=Thelohanellus kitauei TaxID=669202 RepID=A0A0C2I7J9_THEKT|nr:hypothetical protein RF11_11268 [Thelohanellus kitauei]
MQETIRSELIIWDKYRLCRDCKLVLRFLPNSGVSYIMSTQINLMDDAYLQANEIEDLSMIKGWDSTKMKAKLILSTQIKWRPLLKKNAMRELQKVATQAQEYQACRKAAIVIIQ